MVGKTKTKYLERETAAFKVPEIMIEKCMLQTAGIQDLKRIDIWAAVMMLFILLNPDQRYPFEKDIKLLKANTGNVFVPSAEHLLKTFLKDKRLPMSSAKYMAQQACYYQKLRYIFDQSMEYDPEQGIYEAYELLSPNHLLRHNFEFIEILVDNEKVFSNEVQTKLSKEISSLAATAALCEMCPNTEFFLVCIFPHSY